MKKIKTLIAFAAVLIVSVTMCFSLISASAYSSTVMGDVNSDGKLDIKDATYIQKSLVDLEVLNDHQNALADMDGDGRITISDVTSIMRAIVGLTDMPTIPTQPTRDPDIVDLPFIPAQ